MAAEARSVVVRLTAETAQYIAQMQQAGRMSADAMKPAEAAVMRQSAAIDDLGSKAGKVGLVAAGGLAAMGKAAMDWESQWAGVTKTVDGTTTQLSGLEGELRGMAKSMPATHKEISEVASAAGALGVATADIADFTESMIMLGEATDDLSADEAATSIAQISNVLQSAPEDVDNFSAALVDLGNKGASTEGQILALTARVAGAGATIGLTEQEVLGLSAAMANLGIPAELGGGAVQRVLLGINTAVASGSREVERYAEVAGTSAEEFAEAWKSSPVEAFDLLIQGLGRVRAEGGDVASVLGDMGIKGSHNLQVMLRLAGAGDELSRSLGIANDAWAENTALTDEYGNRLETTASQVQIAWNRIKDAGIEAGGALLPVIADIASGVGTAADAFGSLPDPIQGVTTKLLGITAVVGGGLWFGSKVVSAVRSTRDSLDSLGMTSRSATGDLDGLGAAGQTTGRKLAVIGRNALGIAAVAMSVGALADEIGRIDVENLDRSLTALGRGEVTDEITGVVDSLAEVTSKLNAVDLGEIVTGFGLFGDSTLDKAAKNIDQLDQRLASLVETGEQAQAGALFEEITRLAQEQGVSAEDTAEAFDSYALALRNAGGEGLFLDEVQKKLTGAMGGTAEGSDKAAAATDGLADATAASAAAAEEEAGALRDSIKAMREKTESLLGAFDAETRWRQALMDARDQARESTAGIRGNTDEVLANRRAISGVIDAWNNQSDAVRNNIGRYREARKALVDTATAMGVPKEAAKELADQYLDVPEKIATKIALEGVEDARRQITSLGGWLDQLDGTTATTWIRTIQTGLNTKRDNTDTVLGRASGGLVTGPGGPRDDLVPAMLSNREFVMQAAAVEHYGLDTMFAMNAMRLAGGGSPRGGAVGSTTTATLDDRIAIISALQSIRDLTRDLRATGKNRLSGLDREAARLDLERARRELKTAINREQREAKAAAREQRREDRETRADLRGSRGGLFDSLFPAEEQTTAQQVGATIKDFRTQWEAAGGTWTAALREWAKDARAAAAEYDATTNALDAELTRRDDLTASLSEQQSALESLTSTMDAFGDTVAGRFLSDPFNGRRVDRVAGEAGQATADLEAARAELAAVRASATGDSMTEVARAAELIARIRELEEASAAELEDREVEVTGLEALRETLLTDRANADRMAAALTTLAGKGLDTTGIYGGLYKDLAASGDFTTAEQLAALTRDQIDEYEKLFKVREDSAAAVGALATQAVYGQQHAESVAAVQAATAAVDRANAAVAALEAALPVYADKVKEGAQSAADSTNLRLGFGFAAVNASVQALPAQIAEQKKKAKL